MQDDYQNESKSEELDRARVIAFSSGSIQRHLSAAMTIGVLCLVLSLVFYYCTVLRLQLQRTDFLDLGPYPDAVEYFAQANSIMKEGAPTIQIGYDKLPSRYPPGYPLLMIPWLSCLPHHGILAPFRTNQTIGLLLLIGTFAFYFAIGRALAGGLGTLLLATHPAFITFSRAPLSDLSGASAALLAFALVYLGFRRLRRWPIYCAAVVLGLSVCIRAQLLFFAPLLIAMALFPANQSWRMWFTHCFAALAVFAVAVSPYFILNVVEFGNPLKTGYEFWVPALANKQGAFSFHNVPPQLAFVWSEITANWHEFRVANLFGTGTYVLPAFIVLVAIGLAFVRIGRFEISAFLAGVVYTISTVTYTYVEGRFYIPILFLLVPLAVLPSEWAVRQISKGRFSMWSVGVMALFFLSCIGYPSESGFKPAGNRFQAWDALEYTKSTGRSPRYEAQKEFRRAFADAPGVVLSDIDPPYLNALLPKRFVAAPIDDKHNYRFSRIWHYGKAEAVQLVANALDRGTPVYALLLPSKDLNQDIKRLPSIEGYRWNPTKRAEKSAVIVTLTKNSPASTLQAGFRR